MDTVVIRATAATCLLWAGLACLCSCGARDAAAQRPAPTGTPRTPVTAARTPPVFFPVNTKLPNGMTASVADIRQVEDNLTEREIKLQGVPLGGASPEIYVGFYPTNDSDKQPMLPPALQSRAVARAAIPIRVQARGLPRDGSLLACSASSEGTLDGPCTKLGSPDPAVVPVAHADGVTHIAIVFRGNWPQRQVVSEIDVSYTAVDSYILVKGLSVVGKAR